MRKYLKSLVIICLALMLVFSSLGGVIVAQQAELAVPIMIVNTSFLNIRSGPGAQYTVLVTVVGGTELPVLGIASDGVWYLVATPVGNGWINADFVLPRGDFRYVPLIDISAIAPPVIVVNTPVTIGLPPAPGTVNAGQGGAFSPFSTVERFRALVNVDGINVRTSPTDNGGVLVTLTRDDTKDYAIVGRTRDARGRGFDWLAINVPGYGSGWVEGPKMFMRLSARYHDVLTIVAQEIAVVPLDSSQTPVILGHGSELFLLDISSDGQQVKVETSEGVVGWVPFSSVVTRQGTTTDDIGDVPDNGVVVQGGVVVVQGGSFVDGQGGGFVPSQGQSAAPIAVINTGNLNVRSGPGGQYSEVSVLPGGSEVAIIGMVPDQLWYFVQGTFGQGWIDSDFVLVRGTLNGVPIIHYETAAGTATLDAPIALISSSQVLYAAPGTNFGQVGVLAAPTEATIVARTSDFSWVQLNTPFGYGWVPAAQIILRGDASLIPIV